MQPEKPRPSVKVADFAKRPLKYLPKLARVSRVKMSIIIYEHVQKLRHSGIRMEMLVGVSGCGIKEAHVGPHNRASEKHASPTTRRIRNSRGQRRISHCLCHPPKFQATHSLNEFIWVQSPERLKLEERMLWGTKLVLVETYQIFAIVLFQSRRLPPGWFGFTILCCAGRASRDQTPVEPTFSVRLKITEKKVLCL